MLGRHRPPNLKDICTLKLPIEASPLACSKHNNLVMEPLRPPNHELLEPPLQTHTHVATACCMCMDKKAFVIMQRCFVCINSVHASYIPPYTSPLFPVNLECGGKINDDESDDLPVYCLAADDDAVREMDTTTLCKELRECEADYDKLGTFLHVSLDDIRKQEKTAAPGSTARCMIEMLKKYLRDKKPDLDTLCGALKQVGMTALSDELREKYKGIVVVLYVISK